MFNRLTLLRDGIPPPEPERYGDFWVVSGPFGSVCVTAPTARAIVRQLDGKEPTAWVVFRDRSGSHIRVRAGDVRALIESTAAQRAYDRRMARARDHEVQADEQSLEDD